MSTALPVLPPTEIQLRRYFFEIPLFPFIILAIIGATLTLLLFAQAVIIGVIGLVILISSGWMAFNIRNQREQMTDDRYESWVLARIMQMRQLAMQKSGITEDQLIGPVLYVRGFLLPGNRTNLAYGPDNLRIKMGHDGRWHYSANVFTFLFPTDHTLYVYSGTVNALRFSLVEERRTQYATNSITGIERPERIDMVYLNDRGSAYYKIQSFSLATSNGSTHIIDFNAIPFADNAPFFATDVSAVQQTHDALDQLIEWWQRRSLSLS
jgi:hypothetical protein